MKEYLEENFSTPATSTFASRSKAVGLARRIFFYVPPEGDNAVVRRRPDRVLKELKGIQKLHCVKTTPEQGRIFTRSRSCYCLDCIGGEEENYTNKEWLDDWKDVKLDRESSVARTRQAVEETEANLLDTAVRVADLAAKDSVVAIAAANDPDYDYYLMKVASDGLVKINEPTTDDYGCTFPRGSLGLKGFFFVRDNIIDMAFVLAGTVRHVCGELQKQRNNIYKVPLTVNEEIIASL